MVELLERLGCTVEFREEQTCCGQMHLNAGYRDEGLALVERFRGVFAGALGEDFVTAYGVMRRHELSRFDDHVTDWERNEYVEIY